MTKQRPRLNAAPNVQHVTIEGRPTVLVALSGKHGEGRIMTLDAADWTTTAKDYGTAWGRLTDGKGNAYVAAGRVALQAPACHKVPDRTSLLHRLIVGAQRGDVVTFVDCDATNLRRSNLLRLTAAEAAAWRRAQAQQRAAMRAT